MTGGGNTAREDQLSKNFDILINQRLDVRQSTQKVETRWKSLDYLSVVDDISSFSRFLSQSHALELLLLWKAVEQYKACFSNQERAPLALKIWEMHITEGAQWYTFLKPGSVAGLKEQIDSKKLPESLFDDAQNEVYSQLRYQMYPSFLEGLGDGGDDQLKEEPAESLADVLNGLHPAKTRSFTRFAQEQLCEESLLFWLETNDYALLFQPSDLQSRAEAIHEMYMSPQAKYQINLSDKIMGDVEKQIKEKTCTTATFKTGQKEVSEFLEADIFPRYQDWLKQASPRTGTSRAARPSLLDESLLGDRVAMVNALRQLFDMPEEMAKMRKIAKKLEAEENLDFYQEIKEYKQLFQENDRKERADFIYNRHISPKASYLVTLPDEVVKQITTDLVKNGKSTPELFDKAQHETLLLCADNIYPVYLKSPEVATERANANKAAGPPAAEPAAKPPSTGGCCLIS